MLRAWLRCCLGGGVDSGVGYVELVPVCGAPGEGVTEAGGVEAWL